MDEFLSTDEQSDAQYVEIYSSPFRDYIQLCIHNRSGIVHITVDECDRLIELLEECRGEVYDRAVKRGVDDQKPKWGGSAFIELSEETGVDDD